jgi:hypothetical protein
LETQFWVHKLSDYPALANIVLKPKLRVMMEAARTSETPADIQLRTRQYIPEDSELHTRRRENLKSHIVLKILLWFPKTYKCEVGFSSSF